MDEHEEIAAWEAAGRRIDTPTGQVWLRHVPAATDHGLDPVLVLHGFPTSSHDWRHVLGALSAERDVVLFDFVGFGLSDKPDRRYRLEDQADVAEAVVAAVGCDRVALVSHDMGNSVGGELLARDLDGRLGFAVSRRVLTNGSIYIDMAQLTDGQQLLLSLDDAPFDLGDGGAAFRDGMASTFSPDHPAGDDELACAWALTARADGHTLLARTIRYVEDRRAREARYTGAIESHPAPLGVVWGRVDPVAVAAMAERLVAARPDAPLVWLDDVGHWPMVETPTPFADAVLGMLDG
ncbi:MAG: alpha/beta hydrolase [Acidimicrobiales bacterium]